MEWITIEKKWHEMALRLQTATPARAPARQDDDKADGRSEPGKVSTVEVVDKRDMPSRAMA